MTKQEFFRSTLQITFRQFLGVGFANEILKQIGLVYSYTKAGSELLDDKRLEIN